MSLVPLVIDAGSQVLRAGLGVNEDPTIVRNHADPHLVERGAVQNWEAFEEVLRGIYDEIGIDSHDHPVLTCEPPLSARSNREKWAEMLFETFGAPAAYVALSGIMSLFAAGRTTGIVVESGEGVTQVVPVFDGYTLPNAIQRFNYGGSDFTKYLKTLLLAQEDWSLPDISNEDIRLIKENVCSVSNDYEYEADPLTCEKVEYKLPSGESVFIGHERYSVPQALFNPSILDLTNLYEQKGIDQSISEVINHCDIDIRRSLFDSIILAGGNTLFPNFSGQLRFSLSNTCGVHVGVVVPKKSQHSCWRGASVFTSLPTIDNLWVDKGSYEEEGVRIMTRACLNCTDRTGWELQ